MDNNHEIVIQINAKFVGTGHNSEIVQDKKCQDWILYHAVSLDDPVGRKLMIDHMKWENDWPLVESNSPSLRAEKPSF